MGIERTKLKFSLDKLNFTIIDSESSESKTVNFENIDDVYKLIGLNTKMSNNEIRFAKIWYAKGLKKWGISVKLFNTTIEGKTLNTSEGTNPDSFLMSDTDE